MSTPLEPQQSRVYAVATMDTKGAEIGFVANCLRQVGVSVVTVDVGTLDSPTATPDIPRQQIYDAAGVAQVDSQTPDRGTAVGQMGQALEAFLLHEQQQGRVAGVIGIGGSGGTALITTAMRSLKVGLPKLMVSTVASGNTAPYVDCSDIAMLYSVVDIAGLNRVSRQVLANTAHAMAGMVSHRQEESSRARTVGMTMFGVTTPCVDAVRSLLEPQGFECLVFHATGTGGRTMEQLVESGLIEGVLDLTTTEVADEIAGGVFACGGSRFERLIESRVPLVLSLGALDMVNFGGVDSVPSQYRHRKLHVHNANVTLMRTNVEENIQAAKWISAKLNRSDSPWTLLIPQAGLSALDAKGAPFHDPAADAALFETLRQELKQTQAHKLIELPYHINDQAFAVAAVEAFCQLLPDSAAKP